MEVIPLQQEIIVSACISSDFFICAFCKYRNIIAHLYIYGFLIGAIAIIIRTYNTGYPEGAMLAVLLMNCFAPLIDYCVVQANIRRRLNRVKTKPVNE